MQNKIRIFIPIIYLIHHIIPQQVYAADLYIPCNNIEWIEVIKTTPGIPIKMDGIRGTCNGKDCFMIGMHLTSDGRADIHAQLPDVVGQRINIFIGEELIFKEAVFEYIPPVEFLRTAADRTAFSEYGEAIDRAAAICPKALVKYTGIMGKREEKFR